MADDVIIIISSNNAGTTLSKEKSCFYFQLFSCVSNITCHACEEDCSEGEELQFGGVDEGELDLGEDQLAGEEHETVRVHQQNQSQPANNTTLAREI